MWIRTYGYQLKLDLWIFICYFATLKLLLVSFLPLICFLVNFYTGTSFWISSLEIKRMLLRCSHMASISQAYVLLHMHHRTTAYCVPFKVQTRGLVRIKLTLYAMLWFVFLSALFLDSLSYLRGNLTSQKVAATFEIETLLYFNFAQSVCFKCVFSRMFVVKYYPSKNVVI